jgi:hypothetical protein
VCLAQIFRHLFRLHHRGTPFGKRRFLAGLRRKLVELIDGVAQPVSLALGALDLGAVGIGGSLCLAPRIPKRFQYRCLLLEVSECVEKPAMCSCIDQSTFIVLTVNFDQDAADLFEYLHTDRLIIDESPGASIGELHTAKDQFILCGNIVGCEKSARRMIACNLKHGRYLALFHALPDQCLVAAPAQSQGESVEQDRLSSTRFASENGEAIGKVDIEPIDQNDIAN